MRVGALDFLVGENQKLWLPMRAWAVPRPGSKDSDSDAWDLVPDKPASGPALPLHDLKRWMLFFEKSERFLDMRKEGSKYTIYRIVKREDAMVRYLQAIQRRIPESLLAAQQTILVPAIPDDKVRKQYFDTIRKALPSARILPEPEMVVEYFRLVRQTLKLDESRNNVILVVDIGASTSNLTIVISNRGDEVLGGDSGQQRAGRLRAIQGICGDVAGQRVDEWLARQALGELEDLSVPDRQQLLRSLELAKIEVSRRGQPERVKLPERNHPYILSEPVLRQAAGYVVTHLGPILQDVAHRLWKQMTATEAARQLSEAVLRDRKVDGPQTALRLVDTILLAGGTSRLCGFKNQLLETHFAHQAPRVLEVGESFPVAAAVGALAHILHEKYSPARIRSAEENKSARPSPLLEGALDVDIELAWKPEKPNVGETEHKWTVLEAGDPIVYEGGQRENVLQLMVARGEALKARLIPGTDVKKLKKGLKPQLIVAQESRPQLGFGVDGDRKMYLTAKEVSGISNVWVDLKRFGTIEATPAQTFRGKAAHGQLAFDHADEVVFDFGMSKTVVVTAHPGLLDPDELEKHAADSNAQRRSAEPKAEPPTSPAPSAPASALPAKEPLEAPQKSPLAILEPVPLGLTASTEMPAPPTPLRPTKDAPHGALHHPHFPLRDPQQPQPKAVPEPSHPESAAPSPKPPAQPLPDQPAGPPLHRGMDGFIEAVHAFLSAADRDQVDVPRGDLMFTLLGLATRPVVLLAGPPGCGKSTLARIVAHLLGREHGSTYHEIPVQAHWMNDKPLFGKRGLLEPLLMQGPATHVVLFDEINLTRPEYYLSRFLHAVEHAPGARLKLAPTFALGTLNIDDTSRAPSPKILDRCFLVEVDQVPHTHELRPGGSKTLPKLPRLPSLPDAWKIPEKPLDDRLTRLIKGLEDTVHQHGLRQDLLPSRRVLGDLKRVTALHAALGPTAEDLLHSDDLIDRLITNRILVKLSGPLDQLEAVIKYLDNCLTPDEKAKLRRTARRITLAKQQAKLGFISPWQ